MMRDRWGFKVSCSDLAEGTIRQIRRRETWLAEVEAEGLSVGSDRLDEVRQQIVAYRMWFKLLATHGGGQVEAGYDDLVFFGMLDED